MRDILETLVQELQLYPIQATSARKPIPDYPYSTYNIIGLNSRVSEMGIERQEAEVSTLTIQPQMVLSINSYSDIEIEAVERARELYNLLRYSNVLEDVNGTVVTVQPVSNRTVLLSDHYEYRYGFDVNIRYLDVMSKEREYIDQFEMEAEYD